MKNNIIMIFAALLPFYVCAQSAELPALPELPEGAMHMSPLSPISADPPQLEPIVPLEIKEAQAPSLPDLPALDNPQDFNFFQPGAPINPTLPFEALDDSQLIAEEPVQEIVDISAPPTRRPHERPYRKRFNYSNQHLPAAIYKKTYKTANRHLPAAQHEADYNRVTFVAAARNDVNALRAMLEYGNRSIDIRNAAGETLVEVAARYRAHSALRYLLAKGAPRGAARANDSLSHYALAAK